jgi:hypothetical protein
MTEQPIGPRCGNNPNTRLTDGDRKAVAEFRTFLEERAALRDRIAAAIWARTPEAEPSPAGLVMGNPHGIADAVLAVLPATDRATETEPPLSPDYQHPECGFHWHGRDDMDIPMRDGQPVCPRCELAAARATTVAEAVSLMEALMADGEHEPGVLVERVREMADTAQQDEERP